MINNYIRKSWGIKFVTNSTPAIDYQIIQENFHKGFKGLPIGLGKSYGDCGVLSEGIYWDSINLQKLEIDINSQIATCGSGVTIEQLEREALKLGMFPPVVPGTAKLTIGGCVASDVHGKSHHVAGSFGNHLIQLVIHTSTNQILTVYPEGATSEMFWATVGGMGLTGMIVSAKIKLSRIESRSLVSGQPRLQILFLSRYLILFGIGNH